MSAEQDPQGGSWAPREAAGIGQRVARRRATMRLSAQQVADRCADLGMPGLTRQVLARLEHGRRASVSTAELAVVAAALETAPVLLLYPIGTAETAEFLPGKSAAPWDAARWWGDEVDLGPSGEIKGAARRSAAMLFRDYLQVLAELPSDVTEAAYLSARRHRFGPREQDPAERVIMVTIVALREIREGIRDLGLEPPALPPGLNWLEDTEG
jgi:transcriptional regulator with XRE-family HTH domain